jgi:hypothetical protein
VVCVVFETYWGDADFCTISNQGICTIRHPLSIFFYVSKGTLISLLRRKSFAIKLESFGMMLSFERIVRVFDTPLLTQSIQACNTVSVSFECQS